MHVGFYKSENNLNTFTMQTSQLLYNSVPSVSHSPLAGLS